MGLVQSFYAVEKEDINDHLEERFQEFLNTAKRYVESNYVIYYEAR